MKPWESEDLAISDRLDRGVLDRWDKPEGARPSSCTCELQEVIAVGCAAKSGGGLSRIHMYRCRHRVNTVSRA